MYVDVGARGGLPATWSMAARAGLIHPVFFEPDPEEARRLGRRFTTAKVLPYALGAASEERELNLTRERGRSSLLEPDHAFLERFSGDGWKVERRIRLRIERMDAVWSTAALPPPRYVKIDTQGFELQILHGMGTLLESVICLEHEAAFRPLYSGAPAFHEVYDFLDAAGFDLVRLAPLGLYAGSILEFNALWVRRDAHDDPVAVFWKRMNRVSGHEAVVTWGH